MYNIYICITKQSPLCDYLNAPEFIPVNILPLLQLSSLASHNSLYNGCLVSTGVTNVSQSSHQQTGLGIAKRSSLSSTMQASLFNLTSMLSKMLYPRHS